MAAADGRITPAQVRRARKDLGFFAELIGRPLLPFQLEALQLETRTTVIVGPRQVGKSFALAVLACWYAFKRGRQHVLVLSSVEGSALELLANVRDIASHPLLAGSVDEELKTRVTLRNKSWIQSVTSSQRAVRGKSVDLLILDEAALIDPDVVTAAALPTTLARPDAKVVLASTPWGDSGVFYDWAVSGMDGSDPGTRTFRWSLSQAPWIVASVIEDMRRRLPPLKFRAEVLGEWVGAGDAYFSGADIDAAVADYPMVKDGSGAPAAMGCDWGRQADAHAIVIAGLCDDYGVNTGRPVIAVCYAETSRRRYELQVAEIEAIAKTWDLKVMSERVGVGAAPTELLAARLTSSRVEAVSTTMQFKEDAYGKAALWFASGQLVIPAGCTDLVTQLKGVVATPTPTGGLRIGTRTESTHDDLADAFVFALMGLPDPGKLAEIPPRPVPDGTLWAETAGGTRVPVPLITVRPDQSYLLTGKITRCAGCNAPYRAVLRACFRCHTANPGYTAKPDPAIPAASVAKAEVADKPAGNSWNPDLRQCGQNPEHKYDSRYFGKCPHCNPGAGGSKMPGGGPFPGGGMPPGLAARLGGILGPRR